MSELLYNGGKASRKNPAITNLIVIPPESEGSSGPSVTKHVRTISVHRHHYSIIIIIAALENCGRN